MHIQGQRREQATLFPERLDELISAENPVRVIDAFVDRLDLEALGFVGMVFAETGRLRYHSGDLRALRYPNRVHIGKAALSFSFSFTDRAD